MKRDEFITKIRCRGKTQELEKRLEKAFSFPRKSLERTTLLKGCSEIHVLAIGEDLYRTGFTCVAAECLVDEGEIRWDIVASKHPTRRPLYCSAKLNGGGNQSQVWFDFPRVQALATGENGQPLRDYADVCICAEGGEWSRDKLIKELWKNTLRGMNELTCQALGGMSVYAHTLRGFELLFSPAICVSGE